MPQIEIDCPKCKSGEYRLTNERTGEVMCPYCRNQWLVPELAQGRMQPLGIGQGKPLPFPSAPHIMQVTIPQDERMRMESASGFRQ